MLSLSDYPKAVITALELLGYSNVIGHHFFQSRNNVSTPIFALNSSSDEPFPIAEVTKINAVDAPALAYPGLRGEGPVQWLHLLDRQNVSRGGIDTVYRIETAGGKAPDLCTNQRAAFTVPYAAQCEFEPCIFHPLRLYPNNSGRLDIWSPLSSSRKHSS